VTSFSDSAFRIVDNADATKQVAFEASGITTATTRTYTMPNASTTLVGTDTTQTLTNKTISWGQITGFSVTQRASGPYTIAANGNTGLVTLNCSAGEIAIASGWQSGGEQKIAAAYNYRASTTSWAMLLHNANTASSSSNNYMYVICLAV